MFKRPSSFGISRDSPHLRKRDIRLASSIHWYHTVLNTWAKAKTRQESKQKNTYMHYMSRFSHPKFNLLPKMATHGPFLAVLTLLLMFLCVQCSVADGSTVPLTPNGEHVHAELQKGAKAPNFAEPLRNLKQGTLNFLHTTDTHGWY